VKKVVEDITDYGEIQRAYLGISFREIDSQFAEEMGFDEVNGVYVAEVIENGAAKEAGIEKGDIILRVDNTDINSKSSLLETIGTQRPGDEVKVFVKRDDRLKEYNVVLRNRSGNTDIVKKDKIEMLGGTFEAVSEKDMEELSISHGLKIVTLDKGRLSSAGIREGFIIMFVDKEPVKSVDDLKYIFDSKKGGTLIEGVYPNGQKAYYGVGL
jgi:S1-C subfamily serine protease